MKGTLLGISFFIVLLGGCTLCAFLQVQGLYTLIAGTAFVMGIVSVEILPEMYKLEKKESEKSNTPNQ